jgi:hypothetical protein
MTFRKLDLFLSSGVCVVGGKTPSKLGPLDRPNLNHYNDNQIIQILTCHEYYFISWKEYKYLLQILLFYGH